MFLPVCAQKHCSTVRVTHWEAHMCLRRWMMVETVERKPSCRMYLPLPQSSNIRMLLRLQTWQWWDLAGAMIAIVGDNLGSHSIGRFSAKAKWYCLIDRDCFWKGTRKARPTKDRETYEHIVEDLSKGQEVIEWVKFDLIFKQLRHFHGSAVQNLYLLVIGSIIHWKTKPGIVA